MAGNGLDLQKLFAMQAQLKKDNPPLEGVKQEIVEVAYLKKDGSKDVRPLRLNIPPKAKAPMPLIFVPHYEMKEDSLEIRDYLLKGWAVASCAEFKNEYNAELIYDDLVFNNAALYTLRRRGDIDNDRIAVVRLTELLRTLRPDDPAIYDFALFGIGIGNKYTGNGFSL